MKALEMKTLFLAPLLASTIFVGVARAERIDMDIPSDIQAPRSTLTRAEVIADLQVSRLAGLEDLNRGELSPDTNSDPYKHAVAIYEYLRSSPQFAVLVQRLQQNPNATVLARRTPGMVAQSSR